MKIFSKENRRRAEIAMEKEPSKCAEIKEALISCNTVMGTNLSVGGSTQICFSPYDINRFRTRLENATKLRDRVKEDN